MIVKSLLQPVLHVHITRATINFPFDYYSHYLQHFNFSFNFQVRLGGKWREIGERERERREGGRGGGRENTQTSDLSFTAWIIRNGVSPTNISVSSVWDDLNVSVVVSGDGLYLWTGLWAVWVVPKFRRCWRLLFLVRSSFFILIVLVLAELDHMTHIWFKPCEITVSK